MNDSPPLIIVGNGIAGTTLARQVRKKSTRPILLISEEHPYFFSRTALMYVYMGHLTFEHTQPYESHFWKKNNITLLQERVTGFDPQKKEVFLAKGETLAYGDLVWAVGSRPNRFGWPGEQARRVQGLYHKQDLDQLEAWSPEIKEAVIVGGGLIGIELAEMLHSRGKKVCFLVRENSFWKSVLPTEDAALLNQHILQHGIDLRLNTELERIETDEKGNAMGVVTSKGERIQCQYVGLTAGVHPNIDFLKDSTLNCNRGILVNRVLETNLPNVYAIGDCAEQKEPVAGRRSIEAVWYTGRMMGETLAQTLCETKTAYQPGPWFNSAKFFDIEYQTYGQVSSTPKPDEEKQWFWQHPQKNILLRWAFHPDTHRLLGINSFGIRIRHEVLQDWLLSDTTVETALENFPAATFDPEFTQNYQPEIQAAFQHQFSH
ncbi:MAG: FAD-dependent oxidoreductase [Flavobacteriales bacterium]|jgi:NAD(P)H-nitrite reductase large subunit|nr:FAD-dependent oxidoreductase [Flavobacteriales bacterium]